MAPPPIAQPEPAVAPASPPPAEPVAAPTPAAPAASPESIPASPPRQDNYGPVRAGETLWSIAEFARPDDSISVNQVMLALQQANPDAFIGSNINRLKKGAVLRLPSRDEMASIEQQAAAAMVIEQMREWRASTGAVQPQVESSSTVSRPSAPSDSRLELVPPRGDRSSAAQSGASAGGEGTELRADLARAREQLSTLQQENNELKSRVSDLEQIDSDYKKLVELKNSELAAAQARVRELETELASAPAAAVEEAPEQVAATEPPATEAPSETPAEEVVTAAEEAPEDALIDVSDLLDGEGESATDLGTEAVAEAGSEPEAGAPPSEETAAPPAEAAEEEAAKPWYSNPMILGGGAGVLVLAGLAVIFGRGKKKPKPVR